ncbi:MAG: riboflavin biosynthesis protein RibF, partial [Anaerolineales bacterium]|nr:riboflavin biosynthesis protein RibF [Anaerolineales bacterium]
AETLENLGVDIVITHPFNREIANKTARQFISSLMAHLTIRHLQVGYDFAMGKNRDGDYETLKRLADEFNFSVRQSKPIESDTGVISSSRIRFLIGVGQVQEASQLLGRNYQVHGIVEIGDQRGQTLGFPTANMAVWAEKIIPTAGVYACWAKVRGQTWGAVTNIGVRPTFESHPVPPRVETHLLDYNEDIYGENIQLEFVSRLRDERRFPSMDELITQIHQDTHQARKILSEV